MEYFVAAVLGAVQGVTEFLPISSDGHLFIVREVFGLPDQGLLFDALLHLGTLLAVLVGLWPEWRRVGRGLVSIIAKRQLWTTPEQKLIVLLVVASIPAALAGYFLEDIFAETFRNIRSVALWVAATGSFYLFVEYSKPRASRPETGLKHAIWMGLAQMTALLPGVSRSGTTIATATLLGLQRESAAKFSFLMSGPITAGAVAFSGIKLMQDGSSSVGGNWGVVVVGVVVAFFVGLLALRGLLRFLKTRSLKLFGVYMLALGGILLLANVWGLL
jgi:undecaprenyl-diphosphatase